MVRAVPWVEKTVGRAALAGGVFVMRQIVRGGRLLDVTGRSADHADLLIDGDPAWRPRKRLKSMPSTAC